MNVKTFYYSCGDCETLFLLRTTENLDVDNKYDHKRIVQLAAEDYHDNHDGWESSWPLRFAVFKDDQKSKAASYDVDRESVPVFYARRVLNDQERSMD